MNQTCSLLAVSLTSIILTGCTVKSGTSTTNPLEPNTAQYIYLAQDSPNGSSQPAQILVYPTGVQSNPTPARIITLPGIATIGPIAADSSGNLYVATTADVREYAANASGAATPIRLIPDNSTTTLVPATGLFIPVMGLAADSSGNLYVSESQGGVTPNGGVAIFSSTANGSVAPTRYIPSSSLTTLIQPVSIAVDGTGNLYVSNFGGDLPLPAGVSPFVSVLVFGPSANGNVAPIRVLNQQARELATDASGNLYALTGSVTTSAVSVFAPGASRNTAPIRTLSLAEEELTGFAAGPAGDIYVGTVGTLLNNVISSTPAILEFAPTASGSATWAASFMPAAYTGAGEPGMAVF
jgi:hypothetical protein